MIFFEKYLFDYYVEARTAGQLPPMIQPYAQTFEIK